MLQISDWSIETKPDGTTKDVAYIDGGHHGNEHLGTELAFLVAEYYIEGWINEEQEVIDVLTNTELHILIMLNADGNDFDTRWNVNQVDLNRNYDHYWNTCPTTQPGSSAFSESETLANSMYMNDVVPHADLYITMHTGVWIMLYPWGKWPDQPRIGRCIISSKMKLTPIFLTYPYEMPIRVCTQTAVRAGITDME